MKLCEEEGNKGKLAGNETKRRGKSMVLGYYVWLERQSASGRRKYCTTPLNLKRRDKVNELEGEGREKEVSGGKVEKRVLGRRGPKITIDNISYERWWWWWWW